MSSRTLTIPVLFCLVACVTGVGGCEDEKFTSTIFNPLNLKLPYLPYQQPVRIGIVDHRKGLFDPASWKFEEVGSPWSPLRRRLERYLGQPVQIEALKPFQIAAHVQSGRLQFALLGAGDYLDTSEEFGSYGRIVAISEVRTRQGLIVASAKSDITSIEDLRGKRFAFGPRGDTVLDVAAKEAIVSAGVELSDIRRELLPVPNAFQHHISSREAAFEVVWGFGTNAGVIERDAYDKFPKSGGSLLLRTFGMDNFRILGETPVLRIDTIPAFFLNASENHRDQLAALGLAGFNSPPDDVGKELERLVASAQAREQAVDTPD